jgi:hypothetical protein
MGAGASSPKEGGGVTPTNTGPNSKSGSEKGKGLKERRTVDKTKWKVTDTPQDSGFLPTLGVTLWLGWSGFLLWLILYAILLADKWQRVVILGLMTLSSVLPVNFPGQLGYRMGNWLMSQAEKYFGERVSPTPFIVARFHPCRVDPVSSIFIYPQYSFILNIHLSIAGLKTVIEDEDDLIRHSEHGKALIFAFNPHDMVRFPIIGSRGSDYLLAINILNQPSYTLTSCSASVLYLSLQPITSTIAWQDWRGMLRPDDFGYFQNPFHQTCLSLGGGRIG